MTTEPTDGKYTDDDFEPPPTGRLNGLRQWWSELRADSRRDEALDRRSRPLTVVLAILAILLIGTLVVMVANYRFPQASATPGARSAAVKPGVAYVDALLHVSDALRPWLPNDRIYPTILLDNPQNFQLGALEALRYGVRVLRDDLTRQRSTDALDPDIEKAFTSLNISADAWLFPRAESAYADAAEALRQYRERLIAGNAHFYPRADNLVELIRQFNSLTGGANTRLLNCVGELKVRRSEELIDDPLLQGESIVRTDVGWAQVDDQFYYARGVAFVYREVMVAITVDFAEVLSLRNADELASSIVHDFLDYAQFEPLYVANGRYGSMWANHPYQLLGLLSQVRERSRSLVSMLTVSGQ